ncbi:MAG TPA: hypothetical protein VFH88_11805 [Candidatus Krumholzibacteria bacterium]|nr:hypothetical protein [Candidatus Krumholzibacteria bacterium]
MQAVTTHEGARGDSYVVTFDLPADLVGKRLDTVLFDFVVDATPTSEAEAEGSPFVGVYPLTTAATGSSLQYKTDVPSVRPIVMGQGQKVQLDVTDVVKGWIANPSSNHGLVIGTPAGLDVAAVTLKSGTTLHVMFYYRNRTGGRLSTK